MAKISSVVFSRNFLKISTKIAHRSFMASPARAEKAIQELQKNEYYDKYAEKIAKLQKTSPEEFLSRVDGLEAEKRPKLVPNYKPDATDGKFAQLLKPKEPIAAPADASEAPLDKLMKIDLIQDKTSDEIRAIWHAYHCEKDCISAVIPGADFDELAARALKYSTFLFVLPRPQGYEFIMSQFAKNSVHFTPLLYYQVHKENAPECLTITHFTELKATKEVVLMRGEYDSKVIDYKEAQCLANQLQLYYVKPTDEKLALLESFTNKPDEFKHMSLIKQLETLSL